MNQRLFLVSFIWLAVILTSYGWAAEQDTIGWSKRFSAGESHALAIRLDGTVWGWGINSAGNLGTGTNELYALTPVQMQGINNAVQVDLTYGSSAVLTAKGTVMTCGLNKFGMLGDGTNADSNTLVEVLGLNNVAEIACGDVHMLARKSDGTVWAWGGNLAGQLGDGTLIDRNTPVQVLGLRSKAVAISSGETFSMALLDDGTIWTWGSNIRGQLGNSHPNVSNSTVPVKVKNLTNVTKISAGDYFALALTSDGSAYAWGYNNYGQLGDPTLQVSYDALKVNNLPSITEIFASDEHSLALAFDGALFSWGNNRFGQIGDGTTNSTSLPLNVFPGRKFVKISADFGYVLAMEKNRNLVGWGRLLCLGQGIPFSYFYTPYKTEMLHDIKSISGSYYHSVALSKGGQVLTWGLNNFGQLGNGTLTDNYSPAQISQLSSIIDVVAGNYHSLAAGSDGLVRSWGRNYHGQLGDGTTTDSNIPLTVSGLDGIVEVSAGIDHSLARRSDGTVWAWGRDNFGQLGNGQFVDQYLPVQVMGLNNVISIAAGGFNNYALKDDGTVWSWGLDDRGQLGDDSLFVNQSVPVQVFGLSGITSIAAGWSAGLAVKNDHTVWTWGADTHGQSGDGGVNGNNPNPTPVQVPNVNNAVAVAGGQFFSLILLADGTVLSMGNNHSGTLGVGSEITSSDVSILISDLMNISFISSGPSSETVFAIQNDGSTSGWGLNTYGQLGLGFSNYLLEPEIIVPPTE